MSDRAAAVPPDDTFAAYQEQLSRGHAAMARGDAKAALVAYQAAARLADERPLPHVLVGRTQLRLNRGQDALAAFERALGHAPSDAAALTGKAEALLRLGRRQEAAALRAQLESAAAAAERANADQASALPQPEVLVIAAERAWQDGRLSAAMDEWLAAARAFAAAGQLDAGLDVCQRALLADGGAAKVHLEMSRLYLAAGMTEQAAERMLLLGRLVELGDEGGLRAALVDLISTHAAADLRLAQLVDRLDEPARS